MQDDTPTTQKTTKQVVVSLDLSRFVGSLIYKPGAVLPRHDKKQLETKLAEMFFTRFASLGGPSVTDIAHNNFDPPDVLFKIDGVVHGLELTELIPDGRLEKNAILNRLRTDILSKLTLGPRTTGFVVNISFVNDYAAKIRPGRIAETIAGAMNDFFARFVEGDLLIPIPGSISGLVKSISVFREDMTGDTRLVDPRHPYIVFHAQDTRIVPVEDIPAMVSKCLVRKESHTPSQPSWLVVWSHHPSLASFRQEIEKSIYEYTITSAIRYKAVFHMHMFQGIGISGCIASS